MKKLQLSTKFPKYLLYIRKIWLRIGLIKPNIVLAMLMLKIYFGYTRIRRNVTSIIRINKEFVNVEGRYSKD
jgi:E3 ubiquitin-protein ligase DOA10